MKTVNKIIENNSLTEKEITLLKFLNEGLKNHFGETFTDIDIKDMAEGCDMQNNTVKGIVGSLVKKGIIEIDHFTGGDGKNYECFYFVDQENMFYQPIV